MARAPTETKQPAATEQKQPTGDVVNIVSIPVPFRIVGLIDSDANTMYVPLKALSDFPNLTYAQAKVRIDALENIEPVRSTLVEKGYTVQALTDTLQQLNKIFQVTQIVLATLGVIALFIASVGMFNTMTISLLERTREVGILKTIGASNKDVWMIFLFESILIGALGGLLGVVGGYLFSLMVNIGINILASRFGGQSVSIFLSPWWFIATILSISFLVGALTGFYPARRAANLNPLEALRRE
jgi:putative ABC transport system permease protein